MLNYLGSKNQEHPQYKKKYISQNMAEETNPNSTPAAAPKAAKPAKKPKPPKLEDKPFEEFIQQHFTPTLQKSFADEGIQDMELKFVKQAIPVVGVKSDEQFWQIVGNWQNGKRQFNLYFLDESISGKKGFSYVTDGKQPSTLESFMIDEKRVTLDLLVLYTIQRLNGQKWLTGN
ncbi:MAG: DUF2996 domain-containing protein [Xenococcaceae cyanobacterium MO_188.B19]|nr:DUF2996 domain-containing protein [Xenococcaceae cyanobacterium MO_188.B19]